ncbi:MAG: hypothetical protein HN846_00375 [Candidatus Pacebacteria bacterium]|jgi:hypothetical protein|nr:hypothetical protein [Candidatus Paceibacterota bacterium]MBT4004446.1 hypothetical protein [Candidatus Paceibacterota bacterium]MBT4358558.1 hypothetical protein [Candidatus Paceibacterota bacterium]MBT4680498.1 hypothetical protein [Candidatus Paceibacterota bacterium]MBT6898841.1 hypothetical protein [Candidatus Paceibacterota bacterium]
MNQLIELVYRNRVIKWVVIPALLALLWGLLSFIYLVSSDFSPTTLSFNHQSKRDENQSYSELQGGNVLKGYFKARNNFLGIISIEFKKGTSPVYDQVLFRIRELGSEEWLAENTYDTRQFYYINKFPLGFPIIENSKGKTYEFEMSSQLGTSEESIAVDTLNPVVVSKYKYGLDYLMISPQHTLGFVFDKFSYALSFGENIRYLFLYSLPFIFYYLLILLIKFEKLNKAKLKKFANLPLIRFHLDHLKVFDNNHGYLFTLLIMTDILVVARIYDLISLLVIGFWLLVVFLRQYKSGDTFFVALSCTYFFIFSLSLGFEGMAEKIAIWIYYFLILGSIHGLIELRKK